MPTIWGPVTEITDLGVVAEQCPHCHQIRPCILRSVRRGSYVLFVKTAAPILENSCLCTVCHKTFHVEQWRYAAVVPIPEAKPLPPEDLLKRTNPSLVERRDLKEQVRALGGDARFTTAYEELEGMRPGVLRTQLMQQLLAWDKLAEEQRAELSQQIGDWSRAWRLARLVASGFPAYGCVLPAVAALVIWSAFLWLPATHDWVWAVVTIMAGFGAAALAGYVPQIRSVRRWTRRVLIPEAEEANVSLANFVAVVGDVPESPLSSVEELWPVKVNLETIIKVLRAEGKL